MAKARPIPDLSAEEPYAAAAAKVVATRSQELADHSRDVLDLDDIERVHDMRVATRRLRAALEVFAPCFPEDEHEAALEDVKALADALGERRDRDVWIVALGEFAAGLSAADRRGVESLIDRIRAEQLEANEALEPFVDPERVTAVRDSLRELIEAAEETAGERRGAAVAAAALAVASEGNGAGAIIAGSATGDAAPSEEAP